MCKFTFDEFYPCGCELYHGNKDVKFCSTQIDSSPSRGDTSGWLTTMMIQETDQYHGIDFCYEGIRFMTGPKDRKKLFKWLHCQTHTYFFRDVIDGVKYECPWHDKAEMVWEMMEGGKHGDEGKKGKMVSELREGRKHGDEAKKACVVQ